MDISDGLSIDLFRLSEASGCGALLDLDRLPIAAAAHECSATDGLTPREHALSDGEDFELILAAPAEAAKEMISAGDVPLFDIGQFISEPGLWHSDGNGPQRLEPTGYEHHLA